ncbi:hypothetical protein AB0D86_47790 [Streptomyces sp. NPDC048324]|uniref:hypothetical protein n=1 Tax=Streptomyces sp. NPDC048324 TaxID=3157205 RepID=UPI00341FA494
MIVLILLALLVLAFLVRQALDKAAESDVTGIVRGALVAIVTLVITYVAMRLVPPDAVPEVLHAAFSALRSA